MLIKSLSVTGFRNFTALEAHFAEGVNVLYGDNGSGKTNLLEAIFVLCLGRSQRGATDTVLVNNEFDVYRLAGIVEQDGFDHELSVAYQKGGRRRITIDGPAVRIADLYEQFCVVSAGPEDSSILSGSPSVRRTFIDIYLSQYSRAYLSDLTDYHRCLTQKNAALKSEMDPSPFDALLIEYGSKVMAARRKFIGDIGLLAREFYGRFADGESFAVRYEPSVAMNGAADDPRDIRTAFEKALAAQARREAAAGLALVGPHRDEMAIELKNLPARTHGSQGQWRTAAIALKLAVYELLRSKRRTSPLLLLDEIFAELDSSRASALIAAFDGYDQLFLTTAIDPPEALSENSRRYRLKAGRIEDIA